MLLDFPSLYYSRASKRSSKNLSKEVPKDHGLAGNGSRQPFAVPLFRFDLADFVQPNQRNQPVKWPELNDSVHWNRLNESN